MRNLTNALSSVRTGIILLIITGLASVAGTVVLQRPITEPENLARAYSPETLAWLDRLGLTDVFHSWWFVALLSLLAVNIVMASLERFPAAWRYFSRPYRRPEAHFLGALPLHEEIPIQDAAAGLRAAESAFRRAGLGPQRVGTGEGASLYAERRRFARLAAYVVHASLLLILAGGIADGLWGWRGFVALGQGDQSNEIELRDGVKKALPFAIRCDAAGQENYPDGSPRRWWSQLAVVQDGRELLRKEIEVNEPLVYRGIRFFQASYGSTGEVGAVRLTATRKDNPRAAQGITLRLSQAVPLDAGTTVTFAAFVPDFMIRDGQIESRSDQPNNPAIQLLVTPLHGNPARVWLFPRIPQFAHEDQSSYRFAFRDMQAGYYTGLQVAYEPGQWAVWLGCLLMAAGLALAFYFVHVRAWAVPVSDGRGRLVLWVGASASKNREELEEKFRRLVAEIRGALEPAPGECAANDPGMKMPGRMDTRAIARA
jgi:cytochrome c biogenesis protein